MDHTLDNLIGKSVAPVIVAFVEELSWLTRVLESTNLAEKKAHMLAKELVPYLEERYRTIQRPEARAIAGSQLDAQMSLFVAVRHPEVFGKVAVQSLRFLPPVSDVVSSLACDQIRPIQFYVDWDRYNFRSTEYIDIDLRRDSSAFINLRENKDVFLRAAKLRTASRPGGLAWARS